MSKTRALMNACLEGNLKRVRDELRRGAEVNECTTEPDDEYSLLGRTFTVPSAGRTPLMMAAYGGSVPVVRAVLDAGARIDAVSAAGDTALCEAASSKHMKVVELLVTSGADVNQRAMFTPLYHAASNGDVAMIRWLLARGAEVDAPIWTGTTALMAATAARAAEAVAVLLQRGADPELKDEDGRTALHDAATRQGHPDDTDEPSAIVRRLLRAGAPIDAVDKTGSTALLIATNRTDNPVSLVDVLLEAGARLEARDDGGLTPLARACSMNQLDVAIRLLEGGAKLGTKDKEGRTPFLHVARNGYLDLGYVLLPRVKPSERRRALQLARKSKHGDFVRLVNGERLPAEHIPVSLLEQIGKAEALYMDGRYARALKLYERVPSSYNDRVFAVVSNTAYCLQQVGRHAEAAAQFDRALELAPTKASHLLRAICYASYELGHWKQMLDAALRGTKLAPRDDYLWQQLALAHNRLGNYRDAIKAGERAMRVNPKNGYACMNLAEDYSKVGDARYLKTLATSLKLAPQLATELSVADIAALRADRRFAALVRRLRLK